MPSGETVIEDGDEVFLLAAEEHIRTVMRELRRSVEPVRRVMIAGGGNIGLRVAQALESRCEVKPSRSTGGVPNSWPPP
jgi:trk system potassium uptake protein TrkA